MGTHQTFELYIYIYITNRLCSALSIVQFWLHSMLLMQHLHTRCHIIHVHSGIGTYQMLLCEHRSIFAIRTVDMRVQFSVCSITLLNQQTQRRLHTQMRHVVTMQMEIGHTRTSMYT